MILKLLAYIDKKIERISIGLLVISILSMLFLTLSTIILRRLHITSLWIDPLIRHIVFLSAFLGGIITTGSKQHIGIDIIGKYFAKYRFTRYLEWIIYLVAIFTLLWLSYAACLFVKEAFLYEGIVFLGIHRGVLVSIIPVGLLLICYRFFFLLVTAVFPKKAVS